MQKSSVVRRRSKPIAGCIASILTQEPYDESRNFWMGHGGRQRLKDPLWDKCFAKFEAASKREAIHFYWGCYHEAAEDIRKRLPDRFGVVDIYPLDHPEAKRYLLRFCGVAPDEPVLIHAHLHQSTSY